MYLRYLVSFLLCFRLAESAPRSGGSPSDSTPATAPTTESTPYANAETLDVIVKAALIFAFFAITLCCCVLKCRCCSSSSNGTGRSIWIPILIDSPEVDQTCNRERRNRSESRGYPFAPSCPPPVLEAYVGAMPGGAHPLDTRHLPPPPSYDDALQLPKRPRFNSETINEVSS
uniref:Uncharacterized protein n=1 Tax=Plectus sambesii TaxID=2011161 RepID=A0A914X188_9BILA